MHFSRLERFMEEMPLRGVPGCEVAVSVGRETVFRKSVGYADLQKTRPLRGDEITWIYSCSKIITCVAAMRLVERGMLSLGDPVAKYLPAFADLTVRDKQTGIVSPAKNTLTVEHLFTMRGGIHYDIEAAPIMEARNTEGATTRDIVDAMAKVPLNFEPGSHYQYTLCHDVLAAVVEAASGVRFSDYLQANIFDPLGIKDMGFRPNEEQKSRFYQEWNYVNGTNRCTPRTSPHRYQLAPLYESGGAGLFATVGDYMKILTTLANGGTTDTGYSLLRPETVKLLTVNHLDDTALNDFAEARLFGYGWGLCGRVHRDPVVSLSLSPVGEFGWDGAAGAFNMVDTKKRVALYFGTSIFRFTYGYNFLHPTLRNLVYQALEA